MRALILTATAAAALAAVPASALTPTAANQPALENPSSSRFTTSGTRNGLAWTAKNTIVGQTPTSDVLPPTNTIGGGDPIYKPSANKSGTVALIMEYQDGSRFICSGSVIGGGMSIATAAHCVSSGGGVKDPTLVKTTAYFYKGDPDERTPFQAGGVEIPIERYHVAPGYTGEVIDQNDIAILRLASPAPASAKVYQLYTPSSLTGTAFNVAGYGGRSTVGGAQGTSTAAVTGRTGFLREGDNIYDYAWGNALFNGFFSDYRFAGGTENFFGTADVEFSYISDFDNGTQTNNTARRIANAIGQGPIGNAFFADTGVGAREVGIAGGDSGGPGFVDGKLASINSYGLTFGTNFGDFLGAVPPSASALNNSWGEFSGYVPVYIHKDWISGVVPEPGTWAMLIAGFGFVGASMRRRRAVTAA